MIYIARDYNDTVISIVSSKTIESAYAYWQGKDILPNSVSEFNMTDERENEKVGFVSPILNTREVDGYELKSGKKYRIVE